MTTGVPAPVAFRRRVKGHPPVLLGHDCDVGHALHVQLGLVRAALTVRRREVPTTDRQAHAAGACSLGVPSARRANELLSAAFGVRAVPSDQRLVADVPHAPALQRDVRLLEGTVSRACRLAGRTQRRGPAGAAVGMVRVRVRVPAMMRAVEAVADAA